MDLKDGTFAEGHFGLHVFGGSVSYQNVNVTGGKPTKLRVSSLVNVAFQKSIYTARLANGEAVSVQDANEASDQKWVFVPTGDDAGSYSIRTTSGQALDLDAEHNKIQLYSYLGYNNQRWIVHKNRDGSVVIISVYHNRALTISEDGSKLTLETPPTDEMRRNRWKVSSDF